MIKLFLPYQELYATSKDIDSGVVLDRYVYRVCRYYSIDDWDFRKYTICYKSGHNCTSQTRVVHSFWPFRKNPTKKGYRWEWDSSMASIRCKEIVSLSTGYPLPTQLSYRRALSTVHFSLSKLCLSSLVVFYVGSFHTIVLHQLLISSCRIIMVPSLFVYESPK